MKKERWVSTGEYLTWVLCNVIFCILPVGIVCLIGTLNGYLDLTVVFSSILAFVFTLIMISLYTFSPFSRWRSGSPWQDFLIFGSFLVATGVLVVFVIYNVMPQLQQFMNANMQYWFLLLFALVLAVLLNRPVIRERIQDKKAVIKVVDAFNRGEKMGNKWIDLFGGGKLK